MQSADLMEISLPSDQHDFVRAGWIRFTDREWNLLCKGHRVLLPKQIFPGFCSSAIALSRATRDIDNAGASILKYAKTSSAKPTYRSRPVEGRGNSHHISDSTGFSTHHLGKKINRWVRRHSLRSHWVAIFVLFFSGSTRTSMMAS